MKPWWVRIARYAWPHWRTVFLVLLLTLSIVAFDTLKPWPLKLVIDNVLAGQPLPRSFRWIAALPGGGARYGLLAWLTAGTIVLFLSAWLSRMARAYVQAGVGTRMVYDLGADLFDHLQRLSLRFHGRRPTGDLVQRVTSDSGCIRDLAINVFIPLLTSLVSVVAMLTIIWRLDRLVAVVALTAAPAMLVLIKVFAKPMADRGYEQAELQGQTMAMAEHTLTALPIVQAFGREPHEDRRFEGVLQRTARASVRTVVSEIQFQVGTSAVTATGTAVVMAVGGLHVLQGKLTIGALLVLLSYLSSLYAPLETLAWLSSSFATAAAGARRVFEVFDVDREVKDLPGAKPLLVHGAKTTGHVRVEQVTFGYEPGSPVLKRVSLEAQPGETVALVGATGAGKTTLASLIVRFFDPNEGRITLDGIDIRAIQLSSYRSQIAMVLQDAVLLPLSVADNIAYGRPAASRDEVVKAAVAANADEFIRALPQGYDTILGERGATLSGGERQRIAIARAVLKDAPVLILDEPTAALDARTEASILDALERLMKGRTTFIIAHRLSTIRFADKIVVLERGEVVEVGTNSELLNAGGVYHRFYSLQFGVGCGTK